MRTCTLAHTMHCQQTYSVIHLEARRWDAKLLFSQLVIISPKCYQQKWFLGISFLRSRFTLNFTDKFNLIAKKMQIMFPVLHTGKITHAHVACTRSYLLLCTRLVSDMLHLHVTPGRLCGRDDTVYKFLSKDHRVCVTEHIDTSWASI